MADDLATRLNQSLRAASPALEALLSPLGRKAAFPPDIPFQAGQARGKQFNGTIGQITDGAGLAMPVPSLAAGLEALDPELRNRGLLYSPIEGLPELRQAWAEWQRRDGVDGGSSTTPVVTVGLTHGLSLVADLFGGESRAVAVPTPFWGNYRQAFALRTGARIISAPGLVEGRYNPGAIGEALTAEPPGEPAVAILNLPSNPGGYSPTDDERAAIVETLVRVADERPLLVVCDDAYAGLVYDPEVSRRSMFWDLNGIHPNLVPVKIDGSTKEVGFFGGRVGFLTFALEPGSEAEAALVSKVKCLSRATLGSPVTTSQALLLGALRSDTLAAEVEAIRSELEVRYRALAEALAANPSPHLTPLPCNAGCFSLLELGEAVRETPNEVRLHLLDQYDTGLVSIAPRFLRIAFCSVAADAMPELVRRVVAGVDELASVGAGS